MRRTADMIAAASGTKAASRTGLAGTGAKGAPTPAPPGRIQVIECVRGYSGRYLRAQPASGHRLVRDYEPVGPADGIDDPVPWDRGEPA